MKRRKQDSIYSRIEQDELYARPNPPALPLKHEAGLADASFSVPDPVIGNTSLPAQEVARVPDTCVPSCPAEEAAAAEPEAIEPSASKAFPTSTRAMGETDIFQSFANSFVLVAPGTFLMGSPDCEAGRGGDETIHEVTITKPFCIQNTAVTQALWKAVMGVNPASFQEGGDDLPVESVSWNECREFLRRLNSITEGKYRLPTEAEWEFACRAGSSTAFADGDISELYCGRDPVLREMGWYCGNSGRKTRPVGRKNPNGWGLFDMHGNVSEWCLDWYGSYPAESCIAPCGPASGAGKVVRGGSWFGSAKNCRSASRFYWPPNSKSDFIGLRLVREPS